MNEARYLYCIADCNRVVDFGEIGIDDKLVYLIPYKDICAVVHNCLPEPYKSEDSDRVKSWVIAHENVIEVVWEVNGTILPFGFDTIVNGDKNRSADKNLKKWLEDDYEKLRQKLDKLKGKAEFGVQIFWYPEIIAKAITERNREIIKLREDMKTKSAGSAYMYRQKLEMLMRKQMEAEAKKYFNKFYELIKKGVDETKVEKNKKNDDTKQMLLNISCLLHKGKEQDLGEELDKINKKKEFFVRFTGPWPPYSFV